MLYQSEASPPCVKIRALLHFFGQSYEIVRVSMPFKPEIRWSWYKKFPQCIINGQHVTDSPEIFRVLYPLLSGTEMTAQETSIEHDTITYGLMPALQLLMYEDRVSLARFMALATRDMGAIPSAAASAAFFLAGPALPLAPRLRRAHPALRDVATYAADLAALLPAGGGGQFLLGAAAPGALDISLWGTLEAFARSRCPILHRGPLADARLRAWHGRMGAVMAARRPVFDP
jgi:glutathione S-transferase